MDLIDLHTHGIAGHDSLSMEPETYLRMAEAFLEHGTGAFLPTLFPGPAEEMRSQLAAIRKAMDIQARGEGKGPGGEAGQGPVSGGARILGANLEGPFVNPAKCGALDRSSFLAPGIDAFKRLVGGFEDIVRIITVAPELPGALELIEAAAGMNIRVNMGHSAASFEQAAEGRRAGAAGVTHLFNAMSGLHHREPGLAGYALVDDSVYVEIIADMVHLHPQVIRLVLKCKPAERVLLVSDSLGASKTAAAPGAGPVYLPDGETLAGSGITLGEAVKNLAGIGMHEAAAIMLATRNPARFLSGQ